MNKIMLICSLALFVSGYVMATEPAGGAAAGAQATTEAKGTSDAEGVAVVGALLGLALATAGGGDGSSTATTTTTSTIPH
ncbi:hypothetical protein COO59_10310 [Mixta theicola]|uniref:Exopolysaccharide production protein YjbE n=1 Tax=Mixta theicola TaxID=1458355 RepID=A0A2K1QA17_9GAMM|nr:exopolysaccharide production protein YjbE [Mixta theicola]PNS11869.1 hypothetical protein COO59_10310 [Mixta theicola]